MTTLKSTARLTGLAYLGLGLSGMLGFMLVRSQIYAPDDAALTASRLVEHETLARIGIAGELSIVVTQILTGLLFYKLFRRVNSFAAISVAALGFMNGVAILVATMFSASALGVALGSPAGLGDPAATAQLLFDLNDAAWGVGAVFFGLWLLPMGWLVLRSGYMPRALGWVLLVGGVGYVASAYLTQLAPEASVLVEVLVVPATIGELWMIGHLLVKGVSGDGEAPTRVGEIAQPAVA